MNILITGGCGYIGTNVVAHLKERGYRVRILDNLMYGYNPLAKDFDMIKGDIRDPQVCLIALKDIDTVIHLAGFTLEQCDQVGRTVSHEVMVDATKNLFESSIQAGATRFLFASSCSVYGQQSDVAIEESVPNPTTFYAELKLLSEEYLRYRYMPSQFGKGKRPSNFSGKLPYPESMRTTIMRFATAYGPSKRMRWNTIPNKFIADVWQRKPIELFGPQQHRPVMHTQDIVHAIHLLLETKQTNDVETLNIGSNQQNYEKESLVREIVGEIGGTVKIVDTPDARDYRVSFDKIEHLGFKAECTPKMAANVLYKGLNSGEFAVRDDKIVVTT